MIVTIIFDWQGRRLGYVRRKQPAKPKPGHKAYAHELAEAMGYDSVDEAKRKLPKLAHGEKPVYAERNTFTESKRLRKAA